MSVIHRIASVLPKYRVAQEDVKQTFLNFIDDKTKHFNQRQWFSNTCDGSKIKFRYFNHHPWFLWNTSESYHKISQRSFDDSVDTIKMLNNKIFNQDDVLLSKEISHVMIGSEVSNGMSLDNYTHINNNLFSDNLKRRMNIGMGCAGGVINLSQAHDYLKGNSNEAIQTINIDSFSNLFGFGYNNVIQEFDGKHDDASRNELRNLLVPAIILGDAAVSTIMLGKNHPLYKKSSNAGNPIILDTERINLFDSQSNVCFVNKMYGRLPMLKPGVPGLGSSTVGSAINRLLSKNSLNKEEIDFWIIHPGSYKVLQSIGENIGLTNEQMKHSFDVWENHGNCASPSVLLVLEKYMKSKTSRTKIRPNKKKIYGIIAAVGPGLTGEAILVQRFVSK